MCKSFDFQIPALFITALFLLAACTGGAGQDDSPHSDIFFTNNTSQALSFRVVQVGGMALIEGVQYQVYGEDIPPFTTKHILRIQRQNTLAAGTDVSFSTHIENDRVAIELNQTVTSLAAETVLGFGVSAAGEMQPLQTDMNIHRSAVGQSGEQQYELAYRANSKGEYADVYYALTEEYTPAMLDPSPDKLSVLTYNVWALPLISRHIDERLKAMPSFLAGYDVLLLQEAFSIAHEALITTLEEDYGYRYVTRMLDNPAPNFFNGGVILLSRFPIVNQAQAYFPDCAGADCLADKGINYMEVIKGGRSYHIFSAHTSSFDSDIARLYRQNQFKQMKAFTESLNIPKNETVIYGGDFNVNKLLFPDDYQQMITTLEVSEPQYTPQSEWTFNPFINVHGTAFGSGGDHVEYIDYVFVSDAYVPAISTVNNVRIPRSTAQPLWRLWDLSDHFPVEAFIE